MNVRCTSQHDELRWQCALVAGWQRPENAWDKIAESGWAKFHPTITATAIVVTQNLACAVDIYSHSADAEIWDIQGTRWFIRVPQSHFVSHLNPIRFWISHLYNILVNTSALYGNTHSCGFSTKASYSFVISTKDLFVKKVLWPGGSSVHSGSENVHIIIGSQSAECRIQQPVCLLGRIWTPFLRCRPFLNNCHLYDPISERPLMFHHLSAVSIKCFSCTSGVQYCNLPYLWYIILSDVMQNWCRPLYGAHSRVNDVPVGQNNAEWVASSFHMHQCSYSTTGFH
jgi:hypothetical protein